MRRSTRVSQGLLLSCGLVLALLLGGFVPAQAQLADLSSIRDRLLMSEPGSVQLYGETIYQPQLVAAFYRHSGDQLAWPEPSYALQVLDVLESSFEEGLNPRDYHLDALRLVVSQGLETGTWEHAAFDVLLTDGVLLYARHLLEGKVDPRSLDATWNYSQLEVDADRVVASLATAARDRQVAERLEALKPTERFYQSMKRALALHRELGDQRGFTRQTGERLLRRGTQGEDVERLRQRLFELRYLGTPSAAQPGLFDAGIESAVRQLQDDHGLDVDGLVGQQSFDILNLSAADKINRLRVNMDRIRWVREDITNEMIFVNIAGFELYYFRDGELQWLTPVMTGSVNHPTPVFHTPLSYLEFNPTWNAPTSIVRRSLFPKFKANPDYARDNGYQFFDGGRQVPLGEIDFQRYTAANFPYRVVQQPGPTNAMGQVKFMFPNRYAIYLHDTPARNLFSRSARAFSSGCIRVFDPLELARRILDDPSRYSREQLEALVAGGDPRQVVRVTRDIDVQLHYLTVSPTTSERLRFHPDIYDKDSGALRALDALPEVKALHAH